MQIDFLRSRMLTPPAQSGILMDVIAWKESKYGFFSGPYFPVFEFFSHSMFLMVGKSKI